MRILHVTFERVPLPGHARLEHVDRHAFQTDQIECIDLSMLRPTRRDADAAVTDNNRGDAMLGRRREDRIPADLRIIVRMNIDETRCDDVALRIDDGSRIAFNLADLRNQPIADRKVRGAAWRARAVDDETVTDNQIVGHFNPLLFNAEVRARQGIVRRCSFAR